MARPFKLTEKQWAEVERRYLAGEGIRPLAREFGVSEGAIRKRVNTQTKPMRAIANQLAKAEMAFEELPVSTQVKVRSLADRLKGISEHAASAAEYGMMTAHRLSQMAHAEIEKIGSTAGDGGGSTVKSVMVLTAAANEASKIGLNLLTANKGAVMPSDQQEKDDWLVVFEVPDNGR